MRLWGIILLSGIITFAIRLSFIVFFERLTIPEWFQRSLKYVPAAVLSAILVPELFSWEGRISLTWHNPQILAGAFAVFVAWRTRNVFLTLGAGLACFFILNAIV